FTASRNHCKGQHGKYPINGHGHGLRSKQRPGPGPKAATANKVFPSLSPADSTQNLRQRPWNRLPKTGTGKAVPPAWLRPGSPEPIPPPRANRIPPTKEALYSGQIPPGAAERPWPFL